MTHAYSVFDALGLRDTQQFDGAVLDVELRDGVVFPVADRLAELGIPYLFVSAVYDQLVPLRATVRWRGAGCGASRWRGVRLPIGNYDDQLVPLRHRRATFVAKPFHIDRLQEAVQQVVGDACAPRPRIERQTPRSRQVWSYHLAQLTQRPPRESPLAAGDAADVGGSVQSSRIDQYGKNRYRLTCVGDCAEGHVDSF